MLVDITQILRGDNDTHASILIGANGSGKSRMLRRLAVSYATLGVPVVVICNTVYDRFTFLRGVQKIRPHSQLPLQLMKKAIIRALEEGPFRLRGIAETLHYLDYCSDIGIGIDHFDPERVRVLDVLRQQMHGRAHLPDTIEYDDLALDFDVLDEIRLSPSDLEEIISTVSLSERLVSTDTYWLDFFREDFKKYEYEGLARLVKWEKILKKLGILRKVKILLKKSSGIVFDLNEASSGELTLLSTFTHLAVNFEEGGVILIDEPENSLHPSWQHNYVPRLLDLLNLRSPKIYVATHAPIVVSGARTLAAELTSIFCTENGIAQLVEDVEDSVEGTLVEAFGTLTPKNHYLSRQLADGLGALSRGEITLQQIQAKIRLFQKSSYSEEQQDFLEAVNKLAHEVAVEN